MFVKIVDKVVSYIGAIALGAFVMAGFDYGFDKMICLGIIVSAILMASAFIGSEECIPDDEKEE